ncbi:MAG: SDR family oxidoreductase [Rhodococcus sp. (in: high G+C Gram-positive bacteria)]|nr:MAG: SDR family oxidoreductase [Rhodococcus sp. (in: high G+C Gram-positive bacteria)]
MRGLQGMVCLIAGGGSGIGAATARRVAAEGGLVAIGDLNLEKAEGTADEIVKSGGVALALDYDQSEEKSVVALVSRTVEHFGRLDGLHGNAADLSPATLGEDRNLLKMDPEVWMKTLATNLVGNAILVRECLPHLLENGGGPVVLTSSSVSASGEPTRPAYASSKAGLNALVRHIASKWGKQGIRANAVSPGLVLSQAAQEMSEDWFLDKSLAQIRSHRLGVPEDVAATVAFLLSDDAAWVNGQVWGVDGGHVLRD